MTYLWKDDPYFRYYIMGEEPPEDNLRTLSPNKEKKMNDIVDPEMGVEAPNMVFNPETGEVEVSHEVTVTDEGEVATAADVTVH